MPWNGVKAARFPRPKRNTLDYDQGHGHRLSLNLQGLLQRFQPFEEGAHQRMKTWADSVQAWEAKTLCNLVSFTVFVGGINIHLMHQFFAEKSSPFTRGHLGSLCSSVCHFWYQLFDW